MASTATWAVFSTDKVVSMSSGGRLSYNCSPTPVKVNMKQIKNDVPNTTPTLDEVEVREVKQKRPDSAIGRESTNVSQSGKEKESIMVGDCSHIKTVMIAKMENIGWTEDEYLPVGWFSVRHDSNSGYDS